MSDEEETVSDKEELVPPPVGKPCYVYLLEASDHSATYVGATVDLDHRLRQHNKELVGGAKATSIKVAQGLRWNRVLYIAGFPDWQAALQFEWRFKKMGRTKAALRIRNPLQRRLYALQQLLALPASTTKARPYAEWGNGGPQVVYESSVALPPVNG
jgi:structure-specific endonuclease subunit SLX1